MLNLVIANSNLRSVSSCVEFVEWNIEKFLKTNWTKRWKKFNNQKTLIVELIAYLSKQSNSNRALQSKRISKQEYLQKSRKSKRSLPVWRTWKTIKAQQSSIFGQKPIAEWNPIQSKLLRLKSFAQLIHAAYFSKRARNRFSKFEIYLRIRQREWKCLIQ